MTYTLLSLNILVILNTSCKYIMLVTVLVLFLVIHRLEGEGTLSDLPRLTYEKTIPGRKG